MESRKPNPATIRRLRVLRGMSQAQVTEAGGPTSATLVALERGSDKEVRPSTISKLSRALQVPPAVLFLEPGEAEEAVLSTTPLGQPADPAGQLLATLREAEEAYRPEGISLDWSPAVYNKIITSLGETVIRYATADMQTGRQDRATEMLQLLAQVTANLEARKALLEGDASRVQPTPIRPELADEGYLRNQLERLAQTA